jgi:N-glycosylase/DNA lyase
MNKLRLENYNLHWTLMGGQSFSWDYDESNNTYYGFTQDKAIVLREEKKASKLENSINIYWQTYPQKDDIGFLYRYLRLDVNYNEIIREINKDGHIDRAIKIYPDLRLLNQDFEQTLLSFLFSSNNNIKAIRRSIRILNTMFGEKMNIGEGEVFLFPKTELLSKTSVDDLLKTSMGYRAKFLKDAANHLISTDISERINSLETEEARNELIKLKGVGDKIADCILVFSLSRDEITPLDVWGKRFLVNYYNLNPKTNYKDMRKWINNYFGSYTAWAGQFLYEYIRNFKGIPRD